MGLPKQIHAEVNVGTHEIGRNVPKFRNLKLRQQTGFPRLNGGFRRARRTCAATRVCLCRAASSHPLTAASVQRLGQEHLLKLQPWHTEKKSFRRLQYANTDSKPGAFKHRAPGSSQTCTLAVCSIDL